MIPDGGKLLFARTNTHCLLFEGKPKLIGKAYHAKRTLSDETIEIQTVVCFHFGNEKVSDLFLFENNKIKFNSISLYTEAFITDKYRELLQSEIIAPAQFIEQITELYTLREMGF